MFVWLLDTRRRPVYPEANSLAIYRLATAGTKGSFTAKNATVIKLASAVSLAAKNTVTLTPTRTKKCHEARYSTLNARTAGRSALVVRTVELPGLRAMAAI